MSLLKPGIVFHTFETQHDVTRWRIFHCSDQLFQTTFKRIQAMTHAIGGIKAILSPFAHLRFICCKKKSLYPKETRTCSKTVRKKKKQLMKTNNKTLWYYFLALLLLFIFLRILTISIAWSVNTDDGIKVDFAMETSLFSHDKSSRSNNEILSSPERRSGDVHRFSTGDL